MSYWEKSYASEGKNKTYDWLFHQMKDLKPLLEYKFEIQTHPTDANGTNSNDGKLDNCGKLDANDENLQTTSVKDSLIKADARVDEDDEDQLE